MPNEPYILTQAEQEHLLKLIKRAVNIKTGGIILVPEVNARVDAAIKRSKFKKVSAGGGYYDSTGFTGLEYTAKWLTDRNALKTLRDNVLGSEWRMLLENCKGAWLCRLRLDGHVSSVQVSPWLESETQAELYACMLAFFYMDNTRAEKCTGVQA